MMYAKAARRFLALAAVAGLTIGASACNDDDVAAPPSDIVATAQAAGSFNTLLAAVEAAGLTSTLAGPGPFTVFAPTDAAFAALPSGTVQALLNDIPTLTSILTYHVVPGAVTASEVVQLSSTTTVNGQDLTITVANGEVRINGVKVIQTDIQASNGVIHVIEGVLLPN
jgi:uncharacterized surface protein with fasciclin (FAS1) repeats